MAAHRITHDGLVDIGALRLHQVRSEPTGASLGRVLLLGGSNFDITLRRKFLDSAFARDFEFATYSPRGIGQSGSPDGDWTMADYAQDAVACLDHLGWADAIIVGESFGGMTALHLATVAPERITHLILASTTAGGKGGASFDVSEFVDLPRDLAARKAMFLQDTRNRDLVLTDPEGFAAKHGARLAFETAFHESSIVTGGYAHLLKARARHDIWDALPGISTPTLVVSGQFDHQAPASAQQKMTHHLGNAQMWLRPGGHGLLFETPEISEDICSTWLPHADGRPQRQTG